MEADKVFVTATGTKYHVEGCKYLASSKLPISLEDARKKFEPCKVCNRRSNRRVMLRASGDGTGTG